MGLSCLFMPDLESLIQLPFELKTYSFDLRWNGFNVGESFLSFSKINYDQLPVNAKEIYRGGDLYKIAFQGIINFPLLQLILKSGSFTSYVCLKNNDCRPLVSIADVVILGKKECKVFAYDYDNCMMAIDSKNYSVKEDCMFSLRDPVSHVVHLLFRPRSGEGHYFCGHYADLQGNLKRLDIHYSYENGKLIGRGSILANAYFLSTSMAFELPYSYDENRKLFIPSLKEKVAVVHPLLGKVWFESTQAF